jgi:hypothetical protein
MNGTMAYDASSLTPSRPAPPAPGRRRDDGPSGAMNQQMYPHNTLVKQPSFNLTPSSPSSSSYHSAYSGIGGSPDREKNGSQFFSSTIVRNGYVSVKEEGFTSWLWSRKWLVLKAETLTFHKSDVRFITLPS